MASSSRPPGPDKRSAAYSDIFGRPSERRSNTMPSQPQHLQMTAAYPPAGHPGGAYHPGPQSAGPGGSDRRSSMGGQSQYSAGGSARPASYYPQQGYAGPPHPQQYFPGYHPQQQQMMDSHAYHPEPGPSTRILPPLPHQQLSPQVYTQAWQQSQPSGPNGYVADPNERSASFNSRTMSFGSRTQSFGDRTQSFGDRTQSFGDRTQSFGGSSGHYQPRLAPLQQQAPGQASASPPQSGPSPSEGHGFQPGPASRLSAMVGQGGAEPPRLPNIDVGGSQYDFFNTAGGGGGASAGGHDRRSSQGSTQYYGQSHHVGQSPDQEHSAGGGLGVIREGNDFYGFDQYGAGSDGYGGYTEQGRRGSADSDANSFYGTDVGQGVPGYPRSASGNSVMPPSMTSSNRPLLHRKSSESVPTIGHGGSRTNGGGGPNSAGPSPYDQRSYSFSTGVRPPELRQSSSSGPPSAAAASSAVVTASRRAPIVYPALLSRVAEAFKARTVLSERTKNDLTYTECFDGREAVDKIAYIIKTTDRNLALLLGRALDAQKFFHDVTYDHRLRDSPHELYQFKGRLAASPFASRDEIVVPNERGAALLPLVEQASATGHSAPRRRASRTETVTSEEPELPCGVFTLLTDCYSPTCTRDRLCYSIACPRRLEQQARLNLKPKPGLKRAISTESLGDLKEPGTLWIHSVPQDVVDSVSDQEKKRQEAINECIYTERDFVRDLEYLRDSWIKPLQTQNIIPEARRQDFITQVFWNVLDVLNVNSRLCELLSKRQKSAHVVPKLGDIYLDMVPHFGPFVQYGAHQLYGKYEFEKEKSSNPAFAKFVDDTERLPESRKLELNAYLTKPTTRLARYPLLLEVVLKYTPDDSTDKQDIPRVVKMIRELLGRVNVETGKSENRFNLAQLDQQLVFRQGEAVDLRLREEGRELIFKGQLKKRGGGGTDSAELQVFLFDHAILMVKQKNSKQTDQLKVYRKPIPLELLTITGVSEDAGTLRGAQGRKMLMTRTSTGGKMPANGVPPPPQNKQGFSITLNHLGRKGYTIVLWAPTWASRQKWLDKIEGRQAELRDRSLIFEMTSLNEGSFTGANKVNCAAPFDNGRQWVYGTDTGVFLATSDPSVTPTRVIALVNVTQVDVLEEQGILLVLADKAVMTFWIDSLDPSDAVGAAKRARKISSHASFFKVGDCLGRRLVCVVKSGSVSSTIKALEPADAHPRGKKQPAIRKFLQGSNDALRVFKEFYIPTESSSVHFLKSKLCVGCTKGFEIVDLESLDTQGLLDPADSSLDFVQKRENVRPVAIYRVEGEFLLCYDDFAFYVNKNGWRARSNWLIQWEGHPTAFALHYPYVLAFEPTFIEVRHVETGALMQIIPGPNIRHLFAESPTSVSAAMHAQQNRASYYNGHGQPQYGHHPGFAGHLPHHWGRHHPAPAPYAPTHRDQVIFASEGKVLQLKLAEERR